jgi:hypothetical protein
MRLFPCRPAILLGAVLAIAAPTWALPVTLGNLLHATQPADRDVVRNPFGGISDIFGQAVVNAVPGATGVVSSMLSGGGGGGGGFSVVGIGSFGTGLAPRAFSSVVPPPPQNGGIYFALFNTPKQSNVTIGAVQVPEGGITLVLLGASLVGLFWLRRSKAFSALLD